MGIAMCLHTHTHFFDLHIYSKWSRAGRDRVSTAGSEEIAILNEVGYGSINVIWLEDLFREVVWEMIDQEVWFKDYIFGK